VDVSSIVSSADVSTLWEREFRTHIVVPLALHAHRLHALADAVAAEHRVLRAKRALDARALRAFYPPRYARLRRNWRKPITYFESLVRYLEDLPAVPTQSDWSDYQQSPDARVGHPETYNQKQLAVDTYLRSFDGARVLDVGANAGWFSELAVALGHEAIAIEPDDFTASSLFTKAHDRGLPILPLKLDVMWPLGSHGLGLAHPAAPDRLRCDASLWLAILHHLSRNGYTFETISRIVDMFTRTSALIEFVPRDDIHLRGWALANEPWYTMENFVSAMAPYFPEVTVLPSTPAPRVMLHFRRHASQ
jgi:hypothetical protein